ncbi:hypothetical protein [Ramlibacter sp.]|uniref:hypothetical protein n=1 Tax=Ramlibacter sp. TaxID=1917967 RepID=UPI00261DF6DC|nr:hypothetical protein [Ramlibacter sp.]MDB5953989.1 uncharacterized protein [Ramlibacter sp.]
MSPFRLPSIAALLRRFAPVLAIALCSCGGGGSSSSPLAASSSVAEPASVVTTPSDPAAPDVVQSPAVVTSAPVASLPAAVVVTAPTLAVTAPAVAVAAPALPVTTPILPAVQHAWPMLGVTTDDPNGDTASQVDALASLPRRPVLRVVLDQGTQPADYVSSVRRLAAVADVMALPLDSSDMKKVDATQAGDRARRYLDALQDAAPIWEVGNEVNGNWVGSDPVGKIEAMYDAAKAYGKRTAVTFYYENPATPGHDMLPWIDANIPAGHRLRTGLDYVLVSYYEDQNGGHKLTQSEIDKMFAGLAQRFPNAKVGFGEFGWGGTLPTDNAVRAELIQRFYGYTSSEPAFIGGGFYWYFRQTMSPKSKPDYELLRQAAAR